MKATIKEKKEIAKDTLSVAFALEEPINFVAGQFSSITLPYLLYPDEKGPRRFFSFVNPPSQDMVYTISTKLRGSGFKRTLQELPLGSEVAMGVISGKFILPNDASRPLVFIAGGIGITPFMSILSFIKREKLPYAITMIYSNKNRASTAFYDELLTFEKELSQFRLVITMTQDDTWIGEKRRIDAAFIKEYIKDVQNSLFYVVGPMQLNEGAVNALKETGITEENIKTENFTGY